MSIAPSLCCPSCKREAVHDAAAKCEQCGLELKRSESEASYDYLSLLRATFPQRYPLYRALCNNGFVSYHELPEGSVSLAGRKDVEEFADFLTQHAATKGVVLDVGCGPLPVPGYLIPYQQTGATLIGLDVYPTQFAGFRLNGCAEFLPLVSGIVAVVVFATSLDHVCDLAATLREVKRVLTPGGICAIWMSDRRPYWQEFFLGSSRRGGFFRRLLVDLPKQIGANIRDGRRWLYGITHYFVRGRYWTYENGTVFYCPPGAIDPFHSFFERPTEIKALAAQVGLTVTATQRGSNGVFLALRRN